MGIYVSPTDCDDPAVTVTDSHCAEADTLVAAHLANLGIVQSDLSLPIAALTLLGKYYATAAACREKAKGENTTLLDKARTYEKNASTLAARLSRALLGLDTASPATGGGTGSCRVRRG